MERLLANRRLAWAFLAIAAVVFVVRGPARAPTRGDDFAPPYGGVRAWLDGTDPYERGSVNRALLDAGRERDSLGRALATQSVYVPPTFVTIVPFALVPWQAARLLWIAFTLALFAWHLPALLRIAGVPGTSTEAIWIAAGVVALAPYHTGISLGQVAIPSATLLVLAIDHVLRGRHHAGGLLLAASALFKPQITGPFIIYFLLRRGRRAALVCLGVCVAASVITVGTLELNGIPWIESYREIAAELMTPGSQHDPLGPWTAQLLELRPMIALAGIPSPGMVGLGITLLLGAAWYAAGRRLEEREELLLLSGVAVLMLFSMYHRFYDAAVLALPLAWAVRARSAAALMCCAVFFVPGAWALQRLANDGHVAAWLTDSPLWNVVLLRHQNWALVALFVILAAALARRWASHRRADAASTGRTPVPTAPTTGTSRTA